MTILRVIVAGWIAFSSAHQLSAAVLVEFDFSGPGTLSTFASSDPQFTTLDSGITFNDPANAFRVVGSWTYDGTGTAAATGNIFDNAGANFGATTRFDVNLGFASTGNTYTIDGLEIVMRAINDPDIKFSAGFRDSGGTSQVIGSEAIATQSGADPLTSYTVDLSGQGLSATDSSTSFDTSGMGQIRFLFNDTSVDGASDNFQVASIRVLGTVTAVPEPSSIAFLGLLGAGIAARRRKTSKRNPG